MRINAPSRSAALDGDELDAVLLGLRLVLRRDDSPMADAARAALAKLAVPPGDTAAAAPERRTVDAADGTRAMLTLLRDALAIECKLRLDYRDRRGVASARTVWPVALYELDGAEVFAAWCELREEFRHFRLDRVGRARLLDERLPAPRRILLAEWEAAADDESW